MTEVFPRQLLMSIYHGITQYRYRDVQCWKGPFDLAIMQRLIWDLKPRTIIEVGANTGGAALWYGDQLRAYGIDGMVHSIDINPVNHPCPAQTNVKFYQGNAKTLDGPFPVSWIEQQPRPILVNEDSDHSAETSLAVLRWFDQWSRVGEYIVVEDGNTNEIHPGNQATGGPLAAIKTFIDEQGGRYIIDRGYCNMFGPGVTFYPDGYIRRAR